VSPNEIEVGQEYRLLPGARNACMSPPETLTISKAGTTRVVVLEGPDSDGDFRVEALNGELAGDWNCTAPEYLAPLDEPAAEAPELETLGHAEVIAKALDGAYVPLGAYWVKAEVKYGPNGGCAVLVTLDPDVGYTVRYSLTLKEV
jgi:hypothetical protein